MKINFCSELWEMSMCPNSCRMIFHCFKTLSRIFSRVFKSLKLIMASCWTQ
jgi:hypothetical protein